MQLLRLTNKEEDLGKLGRIEDKDILDLELKPVMQWIIADRRQRSRSIGAAVIVRHVEL